MIKGLITIAVIIALFTFGFVLGYDARERVEIMDCEGWLAHSNLTVPEGQDCTRYRYQLKLYNPQATYWNISLPSTMNVEVIK